MKLQVGTKIIAIAEWSDYFFKTNKTIIGKEYTIEWSDENGFNIDICPAHKDIHFLYEHFDKYFKLADAPTKKYMVFIVGRNFPTVEYSNIEEAETEAKRLCEKNLLGSNSVTEQQAIIVSIEKNITAKKEIIFT